MQEIKGPCHECILLQKTPSFLLRMMSSRVKYLRRSLKSNRRQVWQIRNSNYYHPGDVTFGVALYLYVPSNVFPDGGGRGGGETGWVGDFDEKQKFGAKFLNPCDKISI